MYNNVRQWGMLSRTKLVNKFELRTLIEKLHKFIASLKSNGPE